MFVIYRLGLFKQVFLLFLRDGILNPVVRVTRTTGSDKKEYEMTCIPLKYIFGWVFSIHDNRVRPEAKANLQKYKLQCYNALYERFVEKADFYSEKDHRKLELNRKLEIQRGSVKEIKDKISRVESVSFSEWKRNKMQLSIDFDEEQEGNDE